MAFRRLTDSDKEDILELYRQPGETTLTIADRYGVSNTTISRILKSSLSAEEYDRLIQQKRSHRFSSDAPGQVSLLDEAPIAVEEDPIEEDPIEEKLIEEKLIEEEPIVEAPPIREIEVSPGRMVPAPIKRKKQVPEEAPAVAAELAQAPVTSAVEEMLGEDLAPSRTTLLEDDDEDEDDGFDDLDEEFEDDDEDDDGETGVPALQLRSSGFVQVLPIAEAAMPRTCYLVIDRGAELVARPLSEFAELGNIPSAEIEAKTLPVFDNHRVARRFSNIRTQRVIKVPDSRILRKAASHLQAKGITRLLIDGQVYAL